MKKIIYSIVAVLMVLGLGMQVQADEPVNININTRFNIAKFPKAITVGQTGQFEAIYTSPEGYDLDGYATYGVSDSSILEVSETGAWRALKPGVVYLTLTPHISEESMAKYLEVNFLMQEIAHVYDPITVVAATPAADQKTIPASSEPAPVSHLAPKGAVAKTNIEAQPEYLMAKIGCITSCLTLLAIFSYKIFKKKAVSDL